jgi:hypothetical protein
VVKGRGEPVWWCASFPLSRNPRPTFLLDQRGVSLLTAEEGRRDRYKEPYLSDCTSPQALEPQEQTLVLLAWAPALPHAGPD